MQSSVISKFKFIHSLSILGYLLHILISFTTEALTGQNTTYIHTYMHNMYIYAYMHTYIHTYIHTHKYIYIYIYIYVIDIDMLTTYNKLQLAMAYRIIF